jgi:hypothetical protein
MRSGQRSSGDGDQFARQRMSAFTPSIRITPEDDPYSGTLGHAYPAEVRYSATEHPDFDVDYDSDRIDSNGGLTRYATLNVHEPMELPNFSEDRALEWTPADSTGAMSAEPIFSYPYASRGGSAVRYENTPTELFTHVPGRVTQADVDLNMEHVGPTLAALAHRDMPHTVPLNQQFNSIGSAEPGSDDGLYIGRKIMDEMSSARPDPNDLDLKGRSYSDEEIGRAQEDALENAFPTSLNATSRRRSFHDGHEQLRLF